MSLHPRPELVVPVETARIARAAFPKGSVYMRMRDELGVLYQDRDFADLFGVRGQPAESPGRLALVTIMQFVEGLTDRQAADAVRSRIDWKYALDLELTDPGFDYSVLSEFRSRVIAGGAEQRVLDLLLARFKERGLLQKRGRQRTDSTHVLAAVRALNRLEMVGETLRQQVWVQQYYREDGQIHWRAAGNVPSAPRMIEAPYDVEAHYSQKRDTTWKGYKTHLQHVVTAAAMELVRAMAWLGGIPRAPTRRSHFAALAWAWQPTWPVLAKTATND